MSTSTGLSGLGRCCELVSPAGAAPVTGGLALCWRPAVEHHHQHERLGERYDCGHTAYCGLHGGEARAREETAAAERNCWHTLAPAHLSRARVVVAGVLQLSTEHAYVAVRAQEAGRWTAGLGLGGHFEDLVGSWPSPAAAELAAVWVWRRRLEARLATIRDARGGTLDWGLTVRALRRPRVVVVPGPGNLWEHADQALPSTVDIDQRPEVGTNGRERRALRCARAGLVLHSDERRLLTELVARARAEGVQLEDEAVLLAAVRGAA